MKTFETIGISGIIYWVYKNPFQSIARDTIKEKFKFSEKITSIEVDEKEKTLKFNKMYNSYNNRYDYFVGIPLNSISNSVFETDKRIFFLNENEYSNHVKKTVLDTIQRIEKSIIEVTKERNENIRELRQDYWDFLNPQQHEST